MNLVVIGLVTMCLFDTANSDSAKLLNGRWAITANGTSGSLFLKLAPDGKISGTMFDDKVEGVYDSKTRQANMNRLNIPRVGQPVAVQVFTGTFSVDDAMKPIACTLKGTFKVLCHKGWGTPGVEYSWSAVTGMPTSAGQLRELQGHWRLESSDGPGSGMHVFPKGSFLDKIGPAVDIRGNELRHDGAVVATLAIEFVPGDGLTQPSTRRLLMLTLPDGKAVLCAYRIQNELLEIVYPHGIVRFGGYKIFLKRSPKSNESLARTYSEKSIPIKDGEAGASDDEASQKRVALWKALETALPKDHKKIDVYGESPSQTGVLFRSNNVTYQFSLKAGKVEEVNHMKALGPINRITYEVRQGHGEWVLWLNGSRELTIGAEE